MNGQISPPVGQEQWRINLRACRERTKMPYDQIADAVGSSEKTILRIFKGEAKNPGTEVINRIIHVLGTNWSEIFGASGAVIADQDLVAMQAQVDRLKTDLATLQREKDVLQMKLDHAEELIKHKDKIIELQDSHIKLRQNN